MHQRKVLMIVGLAFLPLVAATIEASGQAKPGQGRQPHARSFSEKIQVKVRRLNACGCSMAELAVQIAYRYKLPMAIEHLDRNALRKSLRLNVKDRSVRHVISSIVGSVPGYQVDFSQELVDIYSPAARSDASNPFNTMIRRYDVDGLDTHFASAEVLCAMGRQIDPHSACGGSVAGGQWGSLKITLHLENKRVYEILNAIVAKNGRAIWTPLAQPVGPSRMMTNFWYIYPLDAPFQRVILDRIR